MNSRGVVPSSHSETDRVPTDGPIAFGATSRCGYPATAAHQTGLVLLRPARVRAAWGPGTASRCRERRAACSSTDQ